MINDYGGFMWGNQEAPAFHDEDSTKFLKLAVGAAALGVAGNLAINTDLKSQSVMDVFVSGTKLAGNLSPFQLLNTFRAPEILSPFKSTKSVSWNKSDLSSESTYLYLKKISGLSDKQLTAKGITKKMAGKSASELQFIPTSKTNGKLVSVLGNDKHTVAENISLMARNDEASEALMMRRRVSPVIRGVFAGLDMYKDNAFKESQVFGVDKKIQSLIPVPSITGKLSSLQDLELRTAIPRGVAAFEMGRFNNLITNITEQVFGDSGKKLFKKMFGDSEIRPGPASTMFARYGALAAGIGGAMILNDQLDYYRDSLVGQGFAAGVTSGALSYGMSKVGFSSKNAFLGGVGSFVAQMAMPGFDKGLFEGAATAGVNLDILRGSDLNPVSYYRRTMEGFLPGSTDWKTGALLAVGAGIALNSNIPFKGTSFSTEAGKLLGTKIPKLAGAGQLIEQANLSKRDIFYRTLAEKREEQVYPKGFIQRGKLLRRAISQGIVYDKATKTWMGDEYSRLNDINSIWQESEALYENNKKTNSLNNLLYEELREIDSLHGNDLAGTIKKNLRGFQAQLAYNIAGADLTDNNRILSKVRDLGFGKFSPIGRLGRTASVAGAVLLGHQVAFGGLLGSMQDSEELSDIYSGKKLVEVKDSRWWEGGSAPFEGTTTSYFRPHAYHLMMSDTRDKSIWGSLNDRSPISKFITENFSYDLEQENYYSRPYPISGRGFENVPIIGGFLAATVGNLVKPAKIMHANTWMRDQGGVSEYVNVFEGSYKEPAYGLGAVGKGRPGDPNSLSELHASTVSQFRELEGMTGWGKDIVSKLMFGTEKWNNERHLAETSARINSPSDKFWEASTGGALFTNEIVRRIFPRKEAGYNPIMNQMPLWIPDRFRYGDPYSKLEWGEARLPGKGYASLHKELEGIDPENYPILHKYKILSDIAPISQEFFTIQNQIYSLKKANKLDSQQIAFIEQIDEYRAKSVNKYTFDEDPNAIKLPGSGITSAIWNFGISSFKEVAAPMEYLIPMGFRPTQKLLEDSNVFDKYEQERMYGSGLAFWDKPVRDWLRPAAYTTADLLGYSGKPVWRAQADQTNAAFDQLEFIKWMKLAEEAELRSSKREAKSYYWRASQTRTGLSGNEGALNMYWTLAREEQAYFNEFLLTEKSDRRKVLSMVPEDHRFIYESLWKRIDEGDASVYQSQTNPDKEVLKSKYNTMKNVDVPPVDWIGWNSDVDISDIKVRYLDTLGKDLQEHGMWESNARKSYSQDFLDGSQMDLMPVRKVALSSVRGEIHNMLGNVGSAPQISMSEYPGTQPFSRVEYNDNRGTLIQQLVNRTINGY